PPATRTNGMRRSARSPATSTTCRRNSACISGSIKAPRQPRGASFSRIGMKSLSRTALLATAFSVAAFQGLAAAPALPPWGVELNYLDKSESPGADFFVYANGGWLKSATIPPDRSYAGVNLELNKQNEQRLMDIVADLHKKPSPTAEERKLLDLYDA